MTQNKSEIPALLISLAVVLALVGGTGLWLFNSTRKSGSDNTIDPAEQAIGESEPSPSATSASAQGSARFADITVPSGQFNYGGSTTWAQIRGEIDPIIQNVWPDFELVYADEPEQAPGSSLGIQMLIDESLDFAQSSRLPTEAEKQTGSLQSVPVAFEAVAIAVHPELDIPGLTLDQLADIYTGQTTNWNQVGGPDLEIVPFSRSKVGGTVQFFTETVLNGQPFTPALQSAPVTTRAIQKVGQTPGAIYFASAPEVVSQCTIKPLPIGTTASNLVAPYKGDFVEPEDCPGRVNIVNLSAIQNKSYPLTRELYVVFRDDGSNAQQAGVAYSNLLKTQQGKDLLEQAGFVPL